MCTAGNCELADHIRRMEQNPRIRLAQHRRVVYESPAAITR